MTPLPGSGSLGGCLMGRLMGVSKLACAVAVSMAGMIVAVGYALLADELIDLLDHESIPNWARVAGALIVILLLVLIVRWVRRLAEAPLVPAGAAAPSGDDSVAEDPPA